IIVKTFADAQRMAEQNPPTYRYLTQSGELLDPYRGTAELGPVGIRTGLSSRKSELRDIDDQLTQVDERIGAMTERLERTSEQMQQLEQVQQELRTALFEMKRSEVENNAARNQTLSAIERLRHEQPLVTGEMQSIEMQTDDAGQRAAKSAESLQQLEEQNAQREARIREYDAR